MAISNSDIMSAFMRREATKSFDPDRKISPEDMEFLLDIGRFSPSAFGWEPWQFLVLQNMDIRMEIRENSWGGQLSLPSASHVVLFLGRSADQMKKGSDYLNYMVDEITLMPPEKASKRQQLFHDFCQNDYDLTDDRKLQDYVARQIYLPLANMLTAAALIGIDSCPIEGFDPPKVQEILVKHKLIDPDQYKLVVMAAFGYRKENLPWPKHRRPASDSVRWVN